MTQDFSSFKKDILAQLGAAAFMNDVEKMEALSKYLAPTEEELKKADETVGILVLTAGKLMDDSDFYAYLSVPPSKYMAYIQAEQRGGYMLSDYGEILAFGEGSEPPDEVKKEIEEKHGANHNFIAEMREAVRAELLKMGKLNSE